MWDIIMKDIVPIFVIMLLGFYAGKTKAFNQDNARSFNKLVLNYALPAALFVSIVKADRHMLFEDIKLTLVSTFVIVGVFMWSFFSCYKFFKHTKGEAAVCALIAGSPTIGFLGFAVLDPIFGATANTGLVVAIVSIVVNAITIPIGLSLLNPGGAKVQNQLIKDLSTETGVKKEIDEFEQEMQKLEKNPVISALTQPVAWAPILAVIIVLLGIEFPPILDPNFELISKANSGVAVFAAGLTLSGLKFEFDLEIIYNTFIKLILMPGLLLIVGLLVKLDPIHLQMLVLSGALPPAFSGIIISSRYQVYVRTGTSSLAVSVLLFMVAAPFWIWITRMASTWNF
ncbi:AEC family transporter [Cetobacterium somerae]|jgi:predicted permease|nr:AEC family transporter [Cetobacterium somerae]WVJ03233.1 AEC family transporter [Cetobacterium somerae]